MSRSSFSVFFTLMTILAFIFCLSAQAEETKTVTFSKSESSTVLSKSVLTPGDRPKHELSQRVQVNYSTQSSHPDFNVKEERVYMQMDSMPGGGTNSGVINYLHENGDQTFYTFEGGYKITKTEDGTIEVTYQGDVQVIGGTGKFENIKGSGKVEGKFTPGKPGGFDATTINFEY